VVLATGFSVWGANPTIAQEELIRTLSVTGEGIEMIPTSLSQVQLGIQIEGKTAEDVQQQVAQRSNALVNLLQQRQVNKLQTTGISLQPNYDYSDNDRQLIGYIGTNTVSFEVDTEKAGAMIDEAVKTGATRIDGIGFLATDAAIAEAEKVALREATLDAQMQAQQVLDVLNLEVQEIVGIQINGSNPPMMNYKESSRVLATSAADFQTMVVGGEQTVRASVTLHIRY
jgi:uncharacterized protein YggE